MLHDGWAVCAVFNGIYKRTFDHETNPETQKFVEDWIALETQRGPTPAGAARPRSRAPGPARSFVDAATQSADR